MVDTSHIDLLALIERKAGIRVVDRKPVLVHGIREVHSNCPWCHGSEDSFVIKVDEGFFSHGIREGGCGRCGDPIAFLYEWEGTAFLDACEELGILLDGGDTVEEIRARRIYRPEFAPQSRRWRDTADAKLSKAQSLMHQGTGLTYARSRGFTDNTILDWRLGYVPFGNDDRQRFFTLDADEWGIDHDKKYYMYEGLLIPWFVKGKVWKLQVRRISGKFDQKILPIKDSVTHCLFNQDAINPDKPIVLVESALCAISGSQEADDLATFVATGGTTANRYEHNLALLACAPVVLVAFDNEDSRRGDAGAQYWIDNLPNAYRWLPWAHDINAMLVEGKDIRAWVDVGFQAATLAEEYETTPSPVAMSKEEDAISEETEQSYARYDDARGLLEELLARGYELRFYPSAYTFVPSDSAQKLDIQETYGQRIAGIEGELRDIIGVSIDPIEEAKRARDAKIAEENRPMLVTQEDKDLLKKVSRLVDQSRLTHCQKSPSVVFTYHEMLSSIRKVLANRVVVSSRLEWARGELQSIMEDVRAKGVVA